MRVMRYISAAALLAAGCGGEDGGSGTMVGAPIDVAGPGMTTPTGGTGTVTGGTTAVPLAGTGGTVAPPAGGTGGMMPIEDPIGTEGCKLAMDECGMDTGWPGDEFCILPPPSDMGFQVHVGPSNYATPELQYVVGPGQETDEHFPAVSGNTKDIVYYWRQYRMRAGSHHLIISKGVGSPSDVSRRLGGASIAAKDNPECGIIAPENEHVGMPMAANTGLDVNLHYFNVTNTGSVLQETWVNFWYRDPAVATERTTEMFAMGGLLMAIQPGEHTTLGRYSCPILTPGRVLTMYGHYHANTVRFSAWRKRAGVADLILEDYDWHEPLALEYSSIVPNTPPDGLAKVPGGHNGVLDLQAGDALEWECEVNNTTSGVLRFTNEAVSGEMCILVGDTLGPTVACSFP